MDDTNNNQNKKEIENKEIKEEEKKNDNLTEKKNDEKNDELINENFKEIYSKINLIKQKHKEHSEKDKGTHFSINDYNLDKLMKDIKLKQIFQMFEQTNDNYQNIKNKKSVLFNPHYSIKAKLYDVFNRKSNILNNEKFKNSNEGSTQNKMYSLFQEVNQLNKVTPFKKISYKKVSSSLNKNKKKTINKKYFTTNSIIEKKYVPISSEKFFNSFKENINNNNNGKYINSLSNLKKKNVFNTNRNGKNIIFNKNSKTENNIFDWYQNFTEKYNNNYYSLQLKNLSNAIDRVTNNSNIKKRFNSNFLN